MISKWKGDEFKIGEVAYQYNLKCNCEVLGFINNKGGWWYIQLEPSKGMMETQMIEKLNDQKE